MKYYRRYTGDYLRDTQDLSLAQHGAYALLLDLYYSVGHPIPSPIETLCRICRAITPDERDAIEAVADRYFPLNGDGLRHNKRCDIELQKGQIAIDKMRAAGRNGAARRWDRVPHKNPNGVLIEPPTTNLHPPRDKSKTTPSRKNKPFELPDWIPKIQWDAWIEARTKKRNPPTIFAKRLAIAKLDELRAGGHNPAQVLAQSAFNGWAGLFPMKGNGQ